MCVHACLHVCACGVLCFVYMEYIGGDKNILHYDAVAMTYQAMSYGLGKSSQGYPCEASTAYQHAVGVHLVYGTSGCLLLVS